MKKEFIFFCQQDEISRDFILPEEEMHKFWKAFNIMYKALEVAANSRYQTYYDDNGDYIDVLGENGLAKKALTQVDELGKDLDA